MAIREYVTLAIAVYGAIVSTITLRSNLTKGRQDVGQLDLIARIVCKTSSSTLYTLLTSETPLALPEGEKWFDVLCTNSGRRPLTIDGWQISYVRDNTSQRPASGINPSVTLKESESYVIEIKNFDTLRGGARSLQVKDTHGKLWSLSTMQFQRMKEVMAEHKL